MTNWTAPSGKRTHRDSRHYMYNQNNTLHEQALGISREYADVVTLVAAILNSPNLNSLPMGDFAISLCAALEGLLELKGVCRECGSIRTHDPDCPLAN